MLGSGTHSRIEGTGGDLRGWAETAGMDLQPVSRAPRGRRVRFPSASASGKEVVMFQIGPRWRAMPPIAALSLAAVVLAPAAEVAGAPAVGPAGRAAAGPSLDWPQYLHGPQHSSVSNSTAFTPSNAASARQVWHWQPPVISGKPAPALDASPTVVGGVVYIGAQSGGFYALNESTGAVIWSRQLDTEPTVTCPAMGITSTAAVLPDPVT